MVNRRSFLTGVLSGAVGGGVLGGVGGAEWRSAHPNMEDRRYGTVSFSEMGEDLILYHLLRDEMQIKNATYIDIGAADPILASNTYLLHWNGGHGVLVEPNPALQERLRLHRPHDVIVNAGVGVTDATEADYYCIRNAPMRNTFSKDDVEYLKRVNGGRDVVERVLKMPLISINRLIAEHLGKAPDLLCTDVEGLDYAILSTLDFERFRPAVVITESSPTGRLPEFLASKGYEMRGASLHNVIFADPKRYVRSS